MVKLSDLMNKLNQEYGYEENSKISIERFNAIVKEEKLDEYCTITIDKDDLSIENMVALTTVDGQYIVTTTGERGTMVQKAFEEKEKALSYMIYELRIKKDVAIEHESAYKKMQR